MKKTTLMFWLTSMAAASGHAQPNVTVYGSIDAGLRYQTNVNAEGDGLLTMGTGNYYSNRLGFRGSEDIGGGNKLRFTLESGFVSKSGALDNSNGVLFNRTASVGIGGKWGNIDLGRQYTIAFRTEKFLDPFDHHYTGIVPLSSGAGTTLPEAARTAGLGASSSSGTRFNNSVLYSRTSGPLTLQVQYAAGEIAGDTSKGSAQAAGFMYAGGPLLLAATYTQKETAAGFDNHAYVAGGGFKAGKATVKIGQSRERQATASAGEYRNQTTWAGISYDVTPAVEVALAAYRSRFTSLAGNGQRELLILGASHAFSKRTNLYAELDLNRYEGALVPASGQQRQRGASFGINHLF
ncbi:porin [Massilia niastensis]|uniref:porin n=1 Tax=Massilia niastensis TaxID=544911 RepID=UPI00035E5ECE|nr:porin [Massilia niastensis]